MRDLTPLPASAILWQGKRMMRTATAIYPFVAAFLYPFVFTSYTEEQKKAIMRLAYKLEKLPDDRFLVDYGGTA